MSNKYYNNTTAPAFYSSGTSASVRNQFAAITQAFTDVETDIDASAPLDSPAFTGTPTAPTAASGSSSTQIATTAFVTATALSATLPGQTGNAGKSIYTDGTNAYWSAGQAQTIFIPALSITPRLTSGAELATAEMSTNKNIFSTLNFDTASAEYGQFCIHMPKSWDLGTLTAEFVWSHAATTTNFGVVWGLQAVARSNDDAGDVAFGTAVTVADTGGTTNDIYITGTTSAMTVGGTPAQDDFVMFQVYRVVADGSDTMAVDARLHGIRIKYTIDVTTDV